MLGKRASKAKAAEQLALSAVEKALDGDNLSRPGGELAKVSHGLYRLTAAVRV